MASDDCVVCGKTVRPRQEAIACDTCQLWQHRICGSDVSREDYRRMVRGLLEIEFHCFRCADDDVTDDDTTDVPTNTTNMDAPTDDINVDAPTDDINVDAPTDDTDMDAPTDDINMDAPTDDINMDAPTDDTDMDAPTDDTDTNTPTDGSFHVDTSFVVRAPTLERSLNIDGLVHAEAEEDDPISYREIPNATQRGKPMLVDSTGYSYTLWKQSGDRLTWRCQKRSKTLTCPATVIQNGGTYKQGLKEHTHASEPGVFNKLKIQSEIKTMASSNMFTTSAAEVVTAKLREHADPDLPEPSRPKTSNLIRAVNRQRKKLRPSDPIGTDYELDYGYLDEHAPNFLMRDFDVRSTGNRHLIFLTERQSQLLRDARTWYLDGTFRVVNEPFTQLFTLHAFIRSGGDMKQVPLAFCFMSGRRTDDYYEVLRAIDRYIGRQKKLERVVVDFEAGLWRAVRERFPDVKIQGCAFHWCQAVYRKVQELGLQKAFYQKGEVYNFVRQVMSMHFLPPEHIPHAFDSLRRVATDQLQRLMDYIDRTWISSRTFPVDAWSTYQVSIRTNNDVEGWHNRLNSRCNTRGPVPFYLLVEELFREASDLPLQLRMVSEGKLRRYQRETTRCQQKRIFDLWSRYEDGDITTSQLLKMAARLLD